MACYTLLSTHETLVSSVTSAGTAIRAMPVHLNDDGALVGSKGPPASGSAFSTPQSGPGLTATQVSNLHSPPAIVQAQTHNPLPLSQSTLLQTPAMTFDDGSCDICTWSYSMSGLAPRVRLQCSASMPGRARARVGVPGRLVLEAGGGCHPTNSLLLRARL